MNLRTLTRTPRTTKNRKVLRVFLDILEAFSQYLKVHLAFAKVSIGIKNCVLNSDGNVKFRHFTYGVKEFAQPVTCIRIYLQCLLNNTNPSKQKHQCEGVVSMLNHLGRSGGWEITADEFYAFYKKAQSHEILMGFLSQIEVFEEKLKSWWDSKEN